VILSVVRKYLEISSINDLKQSQIPNENCKIILLDPPDFQLNKFFYKQIGKDFKWFDRLEWSDQKWINYVENPNTETFILKDKDNLVGYFEQILHYDKKNCEIAYFGIMNEFYGKKYGGYLLTEAIKKSFQQDIEKVWLHTCSLDHENAIKNYQARGMKIFKTETINLQIN
jgi:ribosomal protein S18 acetylase RimI-like enzyme